MIIIYHGPLNDRHYYHDFINDRHYIIILGNYIHLIVHLRVTSCINLAIKLDVPGSF